MVITLVGTDQIFEAEVKARFITLRSIHFQKDGTNQESLIAYCLALPHSVLGTSTRIVQNSLRLSFLLGIGHHTPKHTLDHSHTITDIGPVLATNNIIHVRIRTTNTTATDIITPIQVASLPNLANNLA